MVIKIEAAKLAKYVNKKGLHVIFFNSSHPGKNMELVKYMYVMYNKLKHINFFELNWNDYKKFKNIKTDDVMNTVLAYYDGQIAISEPNPTSENLLNFFTICVNLFNEKIDESIYNIGSRQKINSGLSPPNKSDSLSTKTIKKSIYKKSWLLGKKIKISRKENILSKSESLSNWFCDVKIDGIPNDIFEDSNNFENKNILDSKEDKLNVNLNVEKMLNRIEIKRRVYQNIPNFKSLNQKKIIIHDNLINFRGKSVIKNEKRFNYHHKQNSQKL